MSSARGHSRSSASLLAACIQDGDTLIEVGCVEQPLAIDAVGLGAQGALVVERDAARLVVGAEAVAHAGLKDTIRLARGNFSTWPLIPAKHVICHVGGTDVLPLLARLRVAARSGAVLFTRLRPELVSTTAQQMSEMEIDAQVEAAQPGRVALLLVPKVHAAPVYEPAWRNTTIAS